MLLESRDYRIQLLITLGTKPVVALEFAIGGNRIPASVPDHPSQLLKEPMLDVIERKPSSAGKFNQVVRSGLKSPALEQQLLCVT